MKMRRERIPGIRRRKIREYKNYNIITRIYIYMAAKKIRPAIFYCYIDREIALRKFVSQ